MKIEVQIRSLHFQCTCFLKISWNRALLSRKWCYTRQNWQDYHGLRGSASPVLTATGFVNGRWQFSTPHRIHTPWPITKKFGTGDYVRGPYGCAKFGANPSMGGFWANGWNITIFFIYTFFSSTHLQVRRDDGFSHLMAQTTRTRARMCLLGVSLTLLPILGVKTPIFGAWIGVFKPNGQNIESFMLSKLLHRFQPNFAQR